MQTFSHLDKLYWKEDKITKGDLIHYYQKMAPYLLPYLKNRPLVMKRFPEGIDGENFFQKQAPQNLPSFVKTVKIKHETREILYIVCQNLETLLYVVNLGTIELHPFHSRLKNFEKPDYAVLDLDPENVPFDAIVEVALVIHELLKKVPHFIKTSGARGMHIYLPLQAKYTYEQSVNFAKIIAFKAFEKLPKIISLERKPVKRQKRVYIDYLQNHFGQTIVAPYSVRGKPQATVSTPLSWDEIKPGLDPKKFTIDTLPKRVTKKGDLFLPVLEKGIDIEKVF